MEEKEKMSEFEKIFYAFYLTPNRLSLAESYRQAVKVYTGKANIPSLRQMRYRVAKLDKKKVTRMRIGWGKINPVNLWVADTEIYLQKIKFPANQQEKERLRAFGLDPDSRREIAAEMSRVLAGCRKAASKLSAPLLNTCDLLD